MRLSSFRTLYQKTEKFLLLKVKKFPHSHGGTERQLQTQPLKRESGKGTLISAGGLFCPKPLFIWKYSVAF